MSATPRPAPNRCSPIAPGVGVVLDLDRQPEPPLELRARAGCPSQPGRMPPASARGRWRASTGAAKPTPTPIRRSPPTPDSATRLGRQPLREVEAVDRVPVDVDRGPAVGDDAAAEVADRARAGGGGRSRGRRRTRRPGRARPAAAGGPSARRSSEPVGLLLDDARAARTRSAARSPSRARRRASARAHRGCAPDGAAASPASAGGSSPWCWCRRCPQEAASYRLLTRVTRARRVPAPRRGLRTGSRRGRCPRARGSRASRRRRSRRPRPRRTGPGTGSPSAPSTRAGQVGVQAAERLAGEDVQLDRDQRAGRRVEQLVRRRRRA